MSAPLLTTKLYIPPGRPELVPRPRLVELLNAGMVRKLTLVSAPAGFGKTTLLAEWAAVCERPVAWLSLDEGDNDPVCFLGYLVAALQRADAGLGQDGSGLLQSAQPSAAEALLATLINQISALPHGLVLVLDDYHLITAQPVHDALTFLLEHLPANMHLVIASRADPPLPIARLRGRGQLAELRQTDLRFTPVEVAGFLNQAAGLDLPEHDLAALLSRTEGWIAGLQMVAISIQGRRQDRTVSSFVESLTGSHRFILDYLVEEVLEGQSQATQDFLLKTSILNRLCGPLCDAVLSDSPQAGAGQQVLEQLEAANLFIVPLDDERRWYRYHRLFSDLLQQRLHQAHPHQVAALHRRACAWHEENGLLGRAIAHALAAGDYERAAALVEAAAEATLMRSEVPTFLGWVDALPEGMVRARPSLCALHAWALLLAGRPLDEVESRLQDAACSPDVAWETAPLHGQAATLHAFVAIFQGQLHTAGQLSRQALEQLPEGDIFLRGIASWTLGLARAAEGDMDGGARLLSELARTSQGTDNVMAAVIALSNLARLRIRRGQLHQARALYEQALQAATDREGRPLPIAGEALMGLGELMYEWNEFDRAARYLEEGIELTRRWRDVAAMDGYVVLARLRQAQGDIPGADEAIEEAIELAILFDAAEWDDMVVALMQARLWIARGNLQGAEGWLEARGSTLAPLPEAGPSKPEDGDAPIERHLLKYEYLVVARLLLARGEPGEALALLDSLLAALERTDRTALVIEIQILRALALQSLGDAVQATAALKHALALAEPGGYVRIFVNEGEPMAQLLRHAGSRGIRPEYVRRLLAAIELPGPGDRDQPPAPDRVQILIDPLSERELEVLRLLAAGLTNPEIGEQLFIAPSTVRSHVKNIFSKLNVHKRWDAVQRAEELGLL